MKRVVRGAIMPLLAGTATEGLGLRDQVYKTCLAAILGGRLLPGSRLPSARTLAADWRVARNTVDDALAQLHGEGFLVRRVGAGTFVAAQVPGRLRGGVPLKRRQPSALGRKALVSVRGRSASASHASESPPRPAPFLAGLPALDAFPLAVWRRLAARRWRVGGSSLLGYFPSLGHEPLREAIARMLATTRGVDCDAGQVMIVNSAMQAIDLIARVLLDPADSVWVEDPCVPNLRAALAMSGARVAAIPVDADGIDVDYGQRVAPGAGLVYVTPSCQYPLGVTLSLERRLALLRFGEKSGAWIVEDDYQSEFNYAGRPLAAVHSLDRGGRTIYVGTFTNSVFPSLRIAYLVLPLPLVRVFGAVRRQLDDHTHGFMQAVLADFIDGGHFAAHVRKMRAVYQGRRDALAAACGRALSPARLGPTNGGMNAALHLPARWPDEIVAAGAQAAGLHVVPLSRYRSSGARRQNGLLLGYTALGERRIEQGIARLAGVLGPGRR
ncbi:MAG: PLP-dependent aminotransferase family protein [Casimicrobiaceae bacterium]